MLLYPTDIFERLEFDKILERLAFYCLGEPARALCTKVKIFDNHAKISELLTEITEYQRSIVMDEQIPCYHYEAIIDDIRSLRTIDIVLGLEAYQRIYRLVLNIDELYSYFNDPEKQKAYPNLAKIVERIEYDPELKKQFEQIFNDEGKIKSTASPELKRIFSQVQSKEIELDKVFTQVIGKYKKSGYLTENFESYKNSRRVLSVAAEAKRKVKGVIHDESATGRTVYIEPEEVLDLNNDLFEFEARKRHEIYKILKELGNLLRPFLDELLTWQRVQVRLDLIQAKAKFAKEYGGVKPAIQAKEEITLKEVYHPLLYMMNKKVGKKTEAFDLELNPEQRILVVSGPNGGGKSVALKAMGLVQLMLQAGMLVPVKSDSSFRIFSKLMIDIGDQQSLEGDLSTYTSRLIHMKTFVARANRKSLVLIDEFGSGSDPKMGGAIAEGVLDKLVLSGCYGFMTTHYSNIKNYAYNSKHILNGAMLFDKYELQPTFRLKVGQPGSSFAFEIANKIGLPEEILKYARNKAGKDSKTVDMLLIDLQQEKKVLEDELLTAYDERHRLRELIKSYDEMKDSLEIRKKRLKLEAKEKNHYRISEHEKELQDLIKDLKKEKNLEKAQASLKRIREARSEASKEIKVISNEVYKVELEKVKDLKLGQFVKLRTGGDPGKVIHIGEKKVRLQMGLMEFEVPKSELLAIKDPIETKRRSINMDTLANMQMLETELDIRGYNKQDALETIEEFLDTALMSNSVTNFKILHGKGTGVLKRTLWAKAKEYKDISKIWHPEDEFGGHGVTYISF